MEVFDTEVKWLRERLCSHFIRTGEVDRVIVAELTEYLIELKAGRRLPAYPTERYRPRKPKLRPKTDRRRGVHRDEKEIVMPLVYMAW